MQFKVTPYVGPRYWVAISIASMCGTNVGDIIPDVLRMNADAGLIMLTIMFTVVVLAERATRNGGEAFYWVALLIVRAAATNIADYFIGHEQFSYIEVSATLALILIGLIALHRGSTRKPKCSALPPAGSLYWFTMLIAGSLGTVVADGIAHSFGSARIGVPLSAAMATTALLLILSVRARATWVGATSYWTAIVAVRWWGTNAGDILAFLLSLLFSAAITGLALTILLLIRRPRRLA
ncbi:hypothetical protein [Paraburkholderia aspalathi]|uniref:Uncharacterized membrane-anchored protein n=1 Tax=Paraburkholderia aspalathi TaxID=1324617 RepID=A0A1I7BF07_9BURK|nr:hypothetical protein [Paraburkholderia aspalathi]SFT85779.1 Uncharacterized membrane-anchored protein [Paraburkholderia aspalathi]